MLKSKGVQLSGSILTIIGTLVVLYDMFLAEEQAGIFESFGFFIFAVGLVIAVIGGWLKKKENNLENKINGN